MIVKKIVQLEAEVGSYANSSSYSLISPVQEQGTHILCGPM